MNLTKWLIEFKDYKIETIEENIHRLREEYNQEYTMWLEENDYIQVEDQEDYIL